MCSFKQDVHVTLFYPLVLHPPILSRNKLFDAHLICGGVWLFFMTFLPLPPGTQLLEDLCEVLSVPIFLLSLPSAPTSVSSSFVMAVQGGGMNCWLGHTGPLIQIFAVHFLDVLCIAERMLAIFMLFCITIAARGQKQTQGPLCFPSCRQKCNPQNVKTHKTGIELGNAQSLGVSHYLCSLILGLGFSLKSCNNNFLSQCCV